MAGIGLIGIGGDGLNVSQALDIVVLYCERPAQQNEAAWAWRGIIMGDILSFW